MSTETELNIAALPSVYAKLKYTERLLTLHSQAEPSVRLFVRWLLEKLSPEELCSRLPVFTVAMPPEAIPRPEQLTLFPKGV